LLSVTGKLVLTCKWWWARLRTRRTRRETLCFLSLEHNAKHNRYQYNNTL